MLRIKLLSLLVLLLCCSINATGQRKASEALREESARSKQQLAAAAAEYKARLGRLLELSQANLKSAEDELAHRKKLHDQGQISEYDLTSSKTAVEVAKQKVAEIQKKIKEADKLIGQPAPQNQQESAGHPLGQAETQTKPKQPSDIILLDVQDDRLIKDATQELFSIQMEIGVAGDHMLRNLRSAQAILKPYCKCTQKEFEEYLEGEGLPSVINRMNQQNMSRRDSVRFNEYMAVVERIKEYRAGKERLFDSTLELFVSRMNKSFERHGGVGISRYKMEVKERRFVRLAHNEPVISVKASIEKYLDNYARDLLEQIKAATDKLKRENETVRTKRRNRKN